MTKKFVADESTRSQLLDRIYDLVRRVKDGTLDGGKVLYRLQWLIENKDIIPTWRFEGESDYHTLLLEYQVEENIRIGCHRILNLDEREYRGSLFSIPQLGRVSSYHYPVIIDPRINLGQLCRVHDVEGWGSVSSAYEHVFADRESAPKTPYVLWVVPSNTEWEGIPPQEFIRAANSESAWLLSVREMLEYAFHFSDQLPDPRATSIRRPMRMLAGLSAVAHMMAHKKEELSNAIRVVNLTVRPNEHSGDSLHLSFDHLETRNSLMPYWCNV